MVAYMCERPRRAVVVTVAFTVALAVALRGARGARAEDRWTAPYPGVRYLHRSGDGLDYHVVLVDLGDPQISLVATRPGDGFMAATEFAGRYDAQVVINGNFFR